MGSSIRVSDRLNAMQLLGGKTFGHRACHRSPHTHPFVTSFVTVGARGSVDAQAEEGMLRSDRSREAKRAIHHAAHGTIAVIIRNTPCHTRYDTGDDTGTCT